MQNIFNLDWARRVFLEMLKNLCRDPFRGAVANFIGCPAPSGMKHVPTGFKVRTGCGCITVLAEAGAYLHFLVPNRPEVPNQVLFSSQFPPAPNNEVAMLEF